MKMLKRTFIGAALGVASFTAASACDVVHGYEYQMDGAAYQLTLNGVFLDHNTEPGDYFGGGPFMQWIVEGENTFGVTVSQGAAKMKVVKGCRGEFDSDTLVEAEIKAGETRELTFFIENAPPAVYADVGALDDDGLKDAVAALKQATEARDFDTYWAMHEGLIKQAASMGFPEEAMRGMIGQTVAEGAATYQDSLTYTPVMDGRVWQVLTADYKAPITITLEGGSLTVDTGAYWTKIDGEWRVTGR